MISEDKRQQIEYLLAHKQLWPPHVHEKIATCHAAYGVASIKLEWDEDKEEFIWEVSVPFEEPT